MEENTMQSQDILPQSFHDTYFCDEAERMSFLLTQIEVSDSFYAKVAVRAKSSAQLMREFDESQQGIINFLRYYNLSTEEGIILMSLAESLLRIPDSATKKLLLREKLTSADWQAHIKESGSLFVDTATRALVMTKSLLKPRGDSIFSRVWGSMVKRLGEPVIKKAVDQAIQLMSFYFVLGNTIEESIKKSKSKRESGVGFSYDMLGEEAKTQADADVYFEKYRLALEAVARDVDLTASATQGNQGVSVKLSALHPRYEVTQRAECVPALTRRLLSLALIAQKAGISLTVDAEEADRLEMSLEVIAGVCASSEIQSEWTGFGMAVQAYSKRSLSVLEWVVNLAKKTGQQLEVRLVKGAYWDTEIKRSQVMGDPAYPLFTRKENSDVSYLACAEYMLKNADYLQPVFATHNARTIAYIMERQKNLSTKKPIFQVLQGMGSGVLHVLSQGEESECYERVVYAPVGQHVDLLPYLVRRILENGVNTSFVNQLTDTTVDIAELIASPVDKVKQWLENGGEYLIPTPKDIFDPERKNSLGVSIPHSQFQQELQTQLAAWDGHHFRGHYCGPLPLDEAKVTSILSPFDRTVQIGSLTWTASDQVKAALDLATEAHHDWMKKPVEDRAQCLERLADLLHEHRIELLYILINEAGKVLIDAVQELREAEDFCRYYAAMAREQMSPVLLKGYTGETNELRLVGRGVMLCISPWNFPAAIFLGQIVACLVTGNTVLAKPATNTVIIATRMTQLAHEAGIPKACFQLLCGSGSMIGRGLVPDDRVAGVVFTGSTPVAKGIQRQLADRAGAIVPLIAETGGLNALIADTSALPEQLVTDVVESAFGAAGQRCSALRLLLLPEETADAVLEMLAGAMAVFVVGNPRYLKTDCGPVIDQSSADSIHAYCKELEKTAKLVARSPETTESKTGSFVLPCCYEIDDIAQLTEEIFGPVLHVVRYKSKDLDSVIQSINQLGYGLTFGVHSRIAQRVEHICNRIEVGNIYINRDITGAVVGVNPFGGSGLSGTGPKAGGPHYLPKLCHEVTVTNNITAIGGNIELIQSLVEE